MKLAINIALSLLMMAVCLWLVWPKPDDAEQIKQAFRALELRTFWPYLTGFLGLLAVTHFCRAWRWNNLLHPIGVKLPPGPLLAISSVGFMAILALPARLGEFVRPALLRKRKLASASAALGTVAVERIVDGLLVSLFTFGALFALRGPDAPPWMMPTAWVALGVFSGALVFLVFALRAPEATVRFAVACTLTPRFAPRLADKLAHKIHDMIRGFRVLHDWRNLAVFVLWSLAYWVANGFCTLVLARGFHLHLSVVGAFATMGLVAVGITLPNAPGLTGQFAYFTCLGLSLYLPGQVVDTTGKAYAIFLWLLQVIWYLGVGGLAMATRHVSLAEVVAARRLAEDPGDAPG